MSERNNIILIAATGAAEVGKSAVAAGKSDDEVIYAVMRDARDNWMAPTENEAFLASLEALVRVWPDRKDEILAEAQAIGDRSKMLNALMQGVPVDMERWEPAEFPENSLDLIVKWRISEVPS